MQDPELVKIGAGILTDSIEELRQMRKDLLWERRKQNLAMADAPYEQKWIYEDILLAIDNEEKLINKELKNKSFKLDNLLGRGQIQSGLLTEDEVARAKQTSIETFYTDKLRKSGNKLVGRCPFHDEKSGSFFIYKDQNSWWCFGACQEGGDVIAFVMKKNKLDFRAAVKYITN